MFLISSSAPLLKRLLSSIQHPLVTSLSFSMHFFLQLLKLSEMVLNDIHYFNFFFIYSFLQKRWDHFFHLTKMSSVSIWTMIQIFLQRISITFFFSLFSSGMFWSVPWGMLISFHIFFLWEIIFHKRSLKLIFNSKLLFFISFYFCGW